MKETIRELLPRRLKAHRILAGPLRGAKIVTSWHDYPGAILGRTERPLLGWFQANVQPGQTWLDIGAHYGYTAIALAQRAASLHLNRSLQVSDAFHRPELSMNLLT